MSGTVQDTLTARLVELDNTLRELDQANAFHKAERARLALKAARLLLGEVVEKTVALEGKYMELEQRCRTLNALAPSRA